MNRDKSAKNGTRSQAYAPLLDGERTHIESAEDEGPTLFDKNPFEHSWLISKIFFSWVTPLARYGRTHHLSARDLEPSLKKLNAEHLHDDFVKNWDEVPHDHKNAIFKALIKTYKRDFLYAMVINFFQVCVDISVPFMLYAIIEFMSAEPDEGHGIGYGIFLIVAYISVLSTGFEI